MDINFLYKELNYDEEIKKDKSLEPFLQEASQQIWEETNREKYKAPFWNDNINDVCVVVGLPVAPRSKESKMEGVLNKFMKKFKL